VQPGVCVVNKLTVVAACVVGLVWPCDVPQRVHVVKLGFNYHFGVP